MTQKTSDFYAGKPASLPRFVYRRLAQALQKRPASRALALTDAITEVTKGTNPDIRKFKFFLPDFLRRLLSPAEIERFEFETSDERKRADRLKLVYPHVSDEFSLDARFMTSAFGLSDGPEVEAPGSFFTVGSCFARNIATYLTDNGISAATFELAEDLNSPISNAFIFDLVGRPRAEQHAILLRWYGTLFPEASETDARQATDLHLQRIGRMVDQMRSANCIVLTLGNVVDFFRADANASAPLLDKLFPKFVAMPPSEDIAVRSKVASRLKSHGAVLRLASYAETVEAITRCIEGVRAVTKAPIVVTLSPVPIDSAIGLADSALQSAIEVDCISKSRLRSALHDVLPAFQNRQACVHYFPSFEIVRWIAPMLPIPTFGMDDAASRHVSSPILNATCALFVNHHVKWTAARRPPPGQAATAPASTGWPGWTVTVTPSRSPIGS